MYLHSYATSCRIYCINFIFVCTSINIIYICVQIFIYMYTYIRAYTYTIIRTHMYLLTCIYIHTQKHFITRNLSMFLIHALIWMSRITHTNQSCRTYQWVIPNTSMSTFTHANEPCHTCDWVMTHSEMPSTTNSSPTHAHILSIFTHECKTYTYISTYIFILKYLWYTTTYTR